MECACPQPLTYLGFVRGHVRTREAAQSLCRQVRMITYVCLLCAVINTIGSCSQATLHHGHSMVCCVLVRSMTQLPVQMLHWATDTSVVVVFCVFCCREVVECHRSGWVLLHVGWTGRLIFSCGASPKGSSASQPHGKHADYGGYTLVLLRMWCLR